MKKLARILMAVLCVILVSTAFCTVVSAEEAPANIPYSDGKTFTYDDDGAVSLSADSKDDALSFFGDYGDRLNDITAMEDEGSKKASQTFIDSAIATVRDSISGYATFWALLPPIIAIVLALITKEVYSSLFVGILSGTLIYSGFSFTGTMDAVISEAFVPAIADTAGIFMFLVILGVMVSLVNRSGGSKAFGNWAAKHIRTRTGAILATFVLGVLIFIDDYFNCLTVGSVMRPLTDKQKISRAKFSYIIDATAAPVCMIAPISSWAAAVSAYAPEGEGLSLFISAIPYNFYSLLTLLFIIVITLMKFDYGPMKKHEFNAIQNGDLFTSNQDDVETNNEESDTTGGIVLDLVFPIIALIVCCVIALLYIGNGNSFANMNIIAAFGDTDATVGLPWGALIALVITMIYLMIRGRVNFKGCMNAIPAGFKAMVPAILVLTFATALKNTTALLGANVFVGEAMKGAASGLMNFLPAIIFLVACVLSFSTGTSWGTFGILIPIVTAIFQQGDLLMVIGMSACLAGAVCGDHCSPISDTTIMSSAGAQCNHINHVSTQLPYALTVAGISFVCFIVAAFIQNVYISLAIAIVLTVATLFVIKAITNKKAA